MPQVRKYLDSMFFPKKGCFNAPSHAATSVLQSSDGQMFAKVLPLNVTPLIKPMDQGVIDTMKRTYTTKLLNQKRCDLKEFWRNYTILDSTYNIVSAWDYIKL